jgi:hypothetical protein
MFYYKVNIIPTAKYRENPNCNLKICRQEGERENKERKK